MKRTTAIIPNFNGKIYLAPCLDALLSQTPEPPDIIVVDNGSSDDSGSFVEKEYPGVKLIRMEKNLGFGAAVNRGIKESSTEFIALVNNDAVVQPGWLTTLEAMLDSYPDAGAAAPKVLFQTEEKIIDSAGDSCAPYGFIFKRGHFEKDNGQFDALTETFSVSAVATLYRKSLFDRIGLFDENFFAYYEDVDLCFRARLAGWKFYCCPEAVALHRYSATSGKQMKLGTEQVYIYITGAWIKNLPLSTALRHVFSLLLFHSAIAAAVIIAKARKKNRLPGVPVFRYIKTMMRGRKTVRKIQAVPAKDIERIMSRVSVWSALFSRFFKAIG